MSSQAIASPHSWTGSIVTPEWPWLPSPSSPALSARVLTYWASDIFTSVSLSITSTVAPTGTLSRAGIAGSSRVMVLRPSADTIRMMIATSLLHDFSERALSNGITTRGANYRIGTVRFSTVA